MRHLTLVPDLPEEPFDLQPDVRWLTNPEGDSPVLREGEADWCENPDTCTREDHL